MNLLPPTIEGFTLDQLEAIDKPQAKVLRHRLIRRSFQAWCEYRMKQVDRKPALHHLFIIQTIEALLRNELPKPNVMLLMPPGAAKSTYTSVLLPAWFLNPEQFPTELMLACSYSYTLIEGFGKAARDIVDAETNALGISISKTSAAAGDWRTNKGGGYRCAGVNAGIAGNRCRLGFIDDYIGSQEEADSQLIRDKNWEWYWNDFWPRLLPNAWQFIIANRRHEDDLVGRLLADDPDNWHVVKLPMLAEQNDALGRAEGERLWPEWFTEEQVRLAKKLPRTWAGLYQQRPRPEEGNFFEKKHILKYRPNDLPTNLRMYGGSDWAVRKKTLGDRQCHLNGGLDTNGRLWITPDWYWDKCDTLQSTREMFKLQRKNKPIAWWHGRENITGAIAPFVNLMMQQENCFVPIVELSESQDKEAKAASIKARMSAGMVMFPEFHPQWADAENEILTFPGGTNDDFVDALSKFGQGLDKMAKPQIIETPWNGIVPEQRLTCGWMQKSHDRKQRDRSRGVFLGKYS